MHPRLLRLVLLPLMTSGAIYIGVPASKLGSWLLFFVRDIRKLLAPIGTLFERFIEAFLFSSLIALEAPKSTNLIMPLLPRRISVTIYCQSTGFANYSPRLTVGLDVAVLDTFGMQVL